MLQSISISPQISSGETPQGVIVALHGWGANAEDLASLAPFLNLPNYQFIFPTAPFDHPSGFGSKAWYALEKPGAEGLVDSRTMLREYMQNLPQQTNLPLEKTIMMGFSQGGAMSLDVGLRLPLAGLIILSGYLHPFEGDLTEDLPPILLVHGREDQVVPLIAAQSAKTTLSNQGAKVEYEEYDMGHAIAPPVIARVRQFIEALDI